MALNSSNQSEREKDNGVLFSANQSARNGSRDSLALKRHQACSRDPFRPIRARDSGHGVKNTHTQV